MSALLREFNNGSGGNSIQVFVSRWRDFGSDFSMTAGDIIRFTADGMYELDNDGIKVPFSAGMVMGIGFNFNGGEDVDLKIYNTAGDTLTDQVIEVMS